VASRVLYKSPYHTITKFQHAFQHKLRRIVALNNKTILAIQQQFFKSQIMEIIQTSGKVQGWSSIFGILEGTHELNRWIIQQSAACIFQVLSAGYEGDLKIHEGHLSMYIFWTTSF